MAQQEATRQGFGRIEEVGLRIGALSGVDPEALRFALEASTLDTPLAGLKVDINFLPVKAVCQSCGKDQLVEEYVFLCGGCGSHNLQIVQGEEMHLAYIAGHE
jgi:hydrogenase nickel incorporation protein HypA/HybF